MNNASTASLKEPVSWTCLSNHNHALICLARNPDARLRDVALQVGIRLIAPEHDFTLDQAAVAG